MRDEEILSLDAELIDAFIEKHNGARNAAKKVEIDLVAKIQKHGDDPKFMKLGDKLEKLREQHETRPYKQYRILKMLLSWPRRLLRQKKEVVPEEEIDKGGHTDGTFQRCQKNSSTRSSSSGLSLILMTL